jgi:TonB family protein
VRPYIALGLVAVIGCGGSSQQQGGGTAGESSQAAPPPESEAPVALNPDVPIAYPPALYERKVEGDVVLRLFVDSTGKLVPESTKVAEPSGYAALDSAAVSGAAALRFAPAKRHGVPVATAFLQPVEFRQVGTIRTGSGAVALPPAATPAPAPPPNPPPAPPPVTSPRPRPPVVRDTARADTARARPPADTARPAPPPPPPPPPDTTKARTDTSATAH